MKKLRTIIPEFLQHEYIKIAQSHYLEKKKKNLQQGEFLVCLDFAENYTCIVQNAIQSFHWAAKQVILHPFVAYYKTNDKVLYKNFVVISVAVNLFISKLIGYLKSKFVSKTLRNYIIFLMGAASQYKNKSNFINLLYHK